MMTQAQKEQAAKTRAENSAARAAKWAAQAEAINAARLALQKVFESPDATPEQILEAGRLLTELGKRY